jgi:hypothetical protein
MHTRQQHARRDALYQVLARAWEERAGCKGLKQFLAHDSDDEIAMAHH